MSIDLTPRESEILLYLVKQELGGICGDLGYTELIKLAQKLEEVE
ncbi:hypothetical protein AB4238_20715 [Shewanella sp. 10N.286.45.A1]